jgi:DNA-binding NarL/FixJ family response regulator
VNTRVLIADDQALLRGGLRMILEAQDDIDVVGEAIDGRDAVEQVRRLRPDVVVMDVRMPSMDGIEATRRLSASEPATRVLILTMFELDEYVFEALRAGASGFLLKDRPPEELVAAVRVVAAGDALLAPSVTRRLIGEFARRPAVSTPSSSPDRPSWPLSWRCALPPVAWWLVLDHGRCSLHLKRVAGLPQILRRPGVLEENSINVERVEFAGTVAIDSFPNANDKFSQLCVVVVRDHRARRSPLRLAGHKREATQESSTAAAWAREASP